jgi:hypothetical protein
VACREGAGGGDAFNIGEQQASSGQRNNPLDIDQPQRRAVQRRQTRRDFSCRCNPEGRQAEHRCGDDRQPNNSERDGFSRQPALAEHEQHDRGDTDCKHQVMGLAELPGKQHGPSEEIMPAARRANQARQLGHGDRQPRPGLEAYQDAVADQLD